MARNKECLVIILDVRKSADKEFKRNAIQCVADILKDKICSAKKDYVTFILFGTQRTCNNSSGHSTSEDYKHIVQYPEVVVPSWSVLVDFMKFVSEPPCEDGDWLAALVIALGIINDNEQVLKFSRQRFLLFHDFDGPSTFYDSYDFITKNILDMEAQLIVVSRNIQYIDAAGTGQPHAVFRSSSKKSKHQLKAEEHALKLASACNAKLYNFQEAFRNVFLTEIKNPWCWNTQLKLGSKICINISVMIGMQDHSTIKLTRCYGEYGDDVKTETRFYLKGGEVQPSECDLIEGYMLGSTPVAFDEPLKLSDDRSFEPSVKYIGFAKDDAVPREDHQGDSVHLVLHQKGKQVSAKMLDALVKALLNTKMCILCWKIYSAKINIPKLVVLRPNELKDDRPASLSMFELVYPAQHLYWDFPKLRTKKNECTTEQLNAIDNLIDSMDLMTDMKAEVEAKQQSTAAQARELQGKDLLPFDTLPHIYEKCLLDMLERKVLKAVAKGDPYIQELVAEKDYKDIFWRVPEPIEEEAKQAAHKLKKLFPLQRNNIPLVKNINSKPNINNAQKAEQKNADHAENMEPVSKTYSESIACVGCTTPAEDFEKLLKREVLTVDDCTLRDVKFQNIAQQMRETIWQLLFSSTSHTAVEMDRVAEALKVFRRCSFDFHAFADYNEWMHKLKAQIVARKLFNFWSDYVVKQDLGLCFVDVPSLEERLKQEAFYDIQENISKYKLGDSEELPEDDEYLKCSDDDEK